MKKPVVVIGSYNTDLTIKSRRIPQPGETVIGGQFSEGGGGKGANQAVAASRAGADVSFVARIGNDLLGKAGLQRLREELIDTRFVVQDPQQPTGVAFIVVDDAGENSIVVASGANALLSNHDIAAAQQVISASQVMLVQLESPMEAVRAAIVRAHAAGTMVILNPAPAMSLDISVLKEVDIITPNKVEAEMITGIAVTDEESLRAIVQKLLSYGVRHVLITLGSKGVFTGSKEGMEFLPAFRVSTVDSTGAGDVFSGALAAFIAAGLPVAQAARKAIAAASLSVTKLGAQTSAPTLGEIERFIAEQQVPESNVMSL
ncbi:MAG: ribokinase [Bacteroidetes bacterium]|nr:ribokinase [Bacteroidota bacterium]